MESGQENGGRASRIESARRWFVALAIMAGLTIFFLCLFVLWLFVGPSTPKEQIAFVQTVVVLISGAMFLFGLSFIARYLQIPYFSVGAVTFLVAVTVLWGLIKPTTVDQRIGFFQTVGGIVGGSALLFGLYFTAQTLKVNREGQITERFTRAIDQLGSEKLEIRLGGIYSLERIARESEEDHWPIMEVLTAYVRRHAPWPPEEDQQGEEDATIDKKSEEDSREAPKIADVPAPAPDIQAIMTVIQRRTRYYGHGEPEPLDLRETHLSGAYLWEANLRGAYLWGANLREAYLMKADLREADLSGADLKKADLRGADLKGADLTQEQLEMAHGDKHTQLPPHLKRPVHWDVKTDEQPEGE